jgi:peptidoglycan/LPS O-acetylase OafA/YrhL
MVRRLLYLNGIAIFCVVLFHAVGMSFVAMFDWGPRLLADALPVAARLASLDYWVLRIIEQLVVFSIPAFLFVSGYFVAAMTGRSRETLSWDVVFARIKKLLIPYLIWSVVAMALVMIVDGRLLSPRTIVVNLLTGRANEVLYFVPLLIQFYLLAPFLARLARHHWPALLLVTGLLQLVIQIIPMLSLLGVDAPWAGRVMQFIPKWFFLSRIFWFSLGVVFGFHLESFKAALHRVRWLLLGFVIVSIPLGVLEWELYYRNSGEVWIPYRETVLDNLYGLALILTFFAFTTMKLPFTRFMEDLGKDSYGIFLTHIFFIVYTGKLIYRLLPQLLSYELALLLIWIFAGLVGSLALMRLIKPSPVKKLYSYLFG